MGFICVPDAFSSRSVNDNTAVGDEEEEEDDDDDDDDDGCN